MCKNRRASGIFAVVTKVFGQAVAREMWLCAECGLYKIARRIKAFYQKDTDTLVYYHDVISVTLVRTV